MCGNCRSFAAMDFNKPSNIELGQFSSPSAVKLLQASIAMRRGTWRQETDHRIAVWRRTTPSQSWLSGQPIGAADGRWWTSDFCLLD